MAEKANEKLNENCQIECDGTPVSVSAAPVRTSDGEHRKPRWRRPSADLVVATACGVFVALMVGAAYAAVPFYSWFCRATGFGGTPQIVHAVPSASLGSADRRCGSIPMLVPACHGGSSQNGPRSTVASRRGGDDLLPSHEPSASATTAQAVYNVAPGTVGAYFDKINCFCFTRAAARRRGEKREWRSCSMSIRRSTKDSDQDDLNTITLSYTFYPVACHRGRALADQRGRGGGPRQELTVEGAR